LILHGFGLSIGSSDPLDARTCSGLRRTHVRLSLLGIGHLSEIRIDGVYDSNDLLPLA